MDLAALRSRLQNFAAQRPARHERFFKVDSGGYAAHDRFIGVTVPTIRAVAKELGQVALEHLETLLRSPFNEERLLALILLVALYKRSSPEGKEQCCQFYLKNLAAVNNWNLVDASAHLIIGEHLLNRDKSLLHELASSPDLWERRVAIVATWCFIRRGQFDWTLAIAQQLMNDRHDLIHKAVGWMLREVGKRDTQVLRNFLVCHAASMPRTMLRYAIERLPGAERQFFLAA